MESRERRGAAPSLCLSLSGCGKEGRRRGGGPDRPGDGADGRTPLAAKVPNLGNGANATYSLAPHGMHVMAWRGMGMAHMLLTLVPL